MPEHKYLWRASVRGISKPIYLVAQNIASAAAQATNHPQVDVADLARVLRLDAWDDDQQMTIVTWPEPPTPPPPQETMP